MQATNGFSLIRTAEPTYQWIQTTLPEQPDHPPAWVRETVASQSPVARVRTTSPFPFKSTPLPAYIIVERRELLDITIFTNLCLNRIFTVTNHNTFLRSLKWVELDELLLIARLVKVLSVFVQVFAILPVLFCCELSITGCKMKVGDVPSFPSVFVNCILLLLQVSQWWCIYKILHSKVSHSTSSLLLYMGK